MKELDNQSGIGEEEPIEPVSQEVPRYRNHKIKVGDEVYTVNTQYGDRIDEALRREKIGERIDYWERKD